MVNTNDAGRQATDTERTSEEMKWTVAYTHYHLEDKTDEVEHDIGAASALEALLDFIDINTSVTPDEEVEESNLQLEEPSAFNGTVRELAQAFVNGDSPLAFWVSDMDIWHIFSVEQETTEDCSACGGRGRVQTRHPDTDEPIVCQLHPDGEATKDGRCLVCETDIDEPAEVKVLAMIEGGIAEFVTEGNVTVRVIDYDIDGASEDELKDVDGRQAFTGATIGPMPDNFEELWEKAGQ